jgi:hypothetical protein
MIRVRSLSQTAGIALAVAALVACNGGQPVPSFTSGSTGGSTTTSANDGLSHLQGDAAQRIKALASDVNICPAAVNKVPGTYVTLLATLDGSVKGTSFSGGNGGFWASAKVLRATPPPTPTPGTTPTPKPTPTPSSLPTAPPGQSAYYIYYGSYTLKTYGQGCMFLLTSENGKPLKGSKSNGEAIGFAEFNADYTKDIHVETGSLKLTLTGLGANGGTGTAVLNNAKGGGTYDSATITLTGRLLIK